MSMCVRYSGGFYSRQGVTWRCDILQEADVPFEVAELEFPFDEALLIEWNDVAKEEPICGSTATLTIVSPEDRTYLDLYTIKSGQIRLDVYRNGILYWSGCLDPEFYEEPYSRDNNYEVSLTFSDFGSLNRLPYDLSGVRTFRELVETALGRTAISFFALDESRISTAFPDGTALSLSSLCVNSENFIDEDGVAMDWRTVLDGILLPLALRMVQRGGVIYVYDLNGLVSAGAHARIEWSGSDAQLSTDKVYNNIRVTFSPYSKGEISRELTYGDINGPEWTNLTSDASGVKYLGGPVPSGMAAPECYSYYPDYDEGHRHEGLWDYALVDFTLFLSDSAELNPGLASKGTGNRYFAIRQNLGSEQSEGVMSGFYTGGHGDLAGGLPVLKGINPEAHATSVAMTMEPVYLPGLDAEDARENFIRISLEMLFDARYNFAQAESPSNEEGNQEAVTGLGNMAFVPFVAELLDDDGKVLYHYDNSDITANGAPADSVRNTLGKWVSGAAGGNRAWLAYYDSDDLHGAAVGGWKGNRQNFGKPYTLSPLTDTLFYNKGGVDTQWWIFDSFRQQGSAQFIPYPPAGGRLRIMICNGVRVFSYGDKFSENLGTSTFEGLGLYSYVRWYAYKSPRVEVVRRTLPFDPSEMRDAEYSGVANVNAKEDLSLETIVGTVEVAQPTAKGVMMTPDGIQVQMLSRAGVTDHPEQLLIGTLYSQYASRKCVLSGECAIDAAGLRLYTHETQPSGRLFLLSSEVQNLIMGTTDARFVEVAGDEYEGTT